MKYDEDGDGSLSETEFNTLQEKRLGHSVHLSYNLMDKNKVSALLQACPRSNVVRLTLDLRAGRARHP